MTQDTQMQPLLERYAAAPNSADMAALVEGYLPLCRAVARRFGGQGVEREDLEQVAAIALMKAVERFDPSRGLTFSTFAMPTMTGEVRNYIRDRGALMRQGRDTRSQLYRMHQAQDALTQRLQREPSLRELAAEMDISPEALLRLLEKREMSETYSLNAAQTEEDERALEEKLGVAEGGYETVEQRDWLRWVFSQVTPAEKELLTLRFIDRLGQRDVAKRMGVSQMQVSRMERRVLTRLRDVAEC